MSEVFVVNNTNTEVYINEDTALGPGSFMRLPGKKTPNIGASIPIRLHETETGSVLIVEVYPA